ncbi:MAG: hypothetical protein ABI051_15295 [Vicinamibacterales bacterium]
MSKSTVRFLSSCALVAVIAASAALAQGGAPTAPPARDGGPAGAPGQGPAAAQPGGGRPGGPPAAPQAPPLTPAAIERAKQILAATRQALGGERLAAIKSVVASGRAKRVRGNNLVPIEFELSIELPDKYLRKDESPAEETDPTSTGFNGDQLIQLPAPVAPPARAGGPPAPTPAQLDGQRKARVLTIKQDFVRFALGIFADSFTTYPLTFGFAAQAEAPQGKADVLDVRGAGNFAMKLLINSQTRQPIMVSWMLPPTNVIVTVPGQAAPLTVAPGAVVVPGPAAPPASAPQAEKDQYTKDVLAIRQKAQATPVEHRLYFADYRDVDGVQMPFRLRRAIGTDTTEETTFDRFRINTKIDPHKFEPVK